MYLVGVVTCRRPLRPINMHQRGLQTIKNSIWAWSFGCQGRGKNGRRQNGRGHGRDWWLLMGVANKKHAVNPK